MAVRKIINSDKQYTPVVMDKIVLDTVPTVGSFNSVTSDAVARAITDAGNVPAPEASDAGKVLGVLNSSGDIGWVEDQSGTLTQVQSDWEQTDSTQVSFIQHKPDLSVYAEASDVETALATKQDVISDLATIRSGAAAGASAVQPASLATVATTGAYSDLSGKPDLSGFATTQAMNTALAGKQDTIEDLSSIRTGAGLGATAVQPSSLAAVATTGDYDDLVNKPSIPAAQVQSDWNEIDTSSKSFIRNKPVIPAGVIVDQTYDASSANAQSGTAVASAISTKQDIISDLATIRSGAADGATAVQPGNLATVATTGAYSDLSGVPTIPVVDQSYSSSSVNAQSGVAVAGAIAGKQDTIADLATIRANALLGSTAVQPSSLATVATSGSYNDLSDKPSIPAAQVNSDWNSSSGVSQILNKPTLATVATTGDYDDLINKPSIPAAVTVDQTYNASSTNAQSGTAVAEAVAAISVDEVPTVTSNDDGKVLKATYENGSGSYGWESEVKKPIVAGANISITNNANDVTISATDTTYTFSTGLTNNSGTVTVTNPVPAASSSDENKVLGVTDSSGTLGWVAQTGGGGNEVPDVTSSDDGKVLKATYSGGTGSYDWASPPTEKTLAAGSNVNISASGSTVTISATDTTYTFSNGLTNTSGTVTVDNPVPAVTSNDGGKVLTAAYSGGVGSYSWITPSGGGGSGDKFTYHAPAHSIIFWFFENPSFDPSQDPTLSNILYANWTQLSSESNIWQLTLNSGTWANVFYDYANTRSLFTVAFDILSINFSGVTSLNYAFRYAPVRHIHEVLGVITGEASYAFSDTTKLRGHVDIPEIASYYTDRMFEGSTLDSIHIGKLYYEYYPAIEGDPEMGEMSYDEYYTCSNCTSMFYNCKNLKFVDFGVAYLADCSSMFHNCINLQNAAFVNQCVFGSSTLSRMFQDCKSLIWCPDFYFNHTIDQTSMDQYESMGSADHMFDGCSSLLRMPGFSGTTSNCSDLSYMFYNCSSLVSIQWMKISDIGYYSYEDWDPDTGDPTWITTYNVSNVQDMFSLCSNVIGGAANAYQQMSATWTDISNHSGAFYVGSDVGSPEASQIPTSWGGSQS